MTTTAVSALLMTSLATMGGEPRGVVLDFGASWCHYCQQMDPVVDRLHRQGYSIRQVDVDRERKLAEQFGVQNLPTFILVVDGREVSRRVGAVSEQQLREMLGQIPVDPPIENVGAPLASVAEQAPRPLPIPVSAPAPDPADIARQPSRIPVSSAVDVSQVAEVATSESPRSGLIGKLFGRTKSQPDPTEAGIVVRGNISDTPSTPENLLPIIDPLKASVRIHVTVADQTTVGSGTAIDSRTGRTIVMTCGHIFEGWNEQSKIEVDLFLSGEIQRFVGRLEKVDLRSDVGILTIPTDSIVATAQVPDHSSRPREQQSVVSIGCSGGASPLQEPVQVTALNYYEGPDNIECTGVPVQGRSGGGLFNAQGQLVGVCIAADAERGRGAYAGLLAIHELLDAASLTALYRKSDSDGSRVVAGAEEGGPRQTAEVVPASIASTSAPTAEEMQMAAAGLHGDAEVICIIRSRAHPADPSRVVIIEEASSNLLDVLEGENRKQQALLQVNR